MASIYERYIKDKNNVCPYSNNGVCEACSVIKVNCNGFAYINCAQYDAAHEKEVSKI